LKATVAGLILLAGCVLVFKKRAGVVVLHGGVALMMLSELLVGVAAVESQMHIIEGESANFVQDVREGNLSLTVYAVGMALERNPDAGRAMVEAGFEVASHGWRWIDYHDVPEAEERQHIRLAIAAITRATGARPVGWYTGRISPNTRRLVAEEGGFLYDADSYADDLPYWELVAGTPQLIVPYTLDNNDMKYAVANGFDNGQGFFQYLCDAFDVLYAEGASSPKMMSVGLHCRLVGRPGRAAALARFLDYVRGHERVWITTRREIARHWRAQYPYRAAKL
jgi:peptidoglycan/xylan/chitin deacetylase (PgdA/CDA1 family)